MSTNGTGGTLLGKLVTWLLVALVAIAALKLAFWVVGALVGLGTWILFTLGPILLVGWVVLKIVRALRRDKAYPIA